MHYTIRTLLLHVPQQENNNTVDFENLKSSELLVLF